ncbi:MAG: YdbL family protein [Opitutaceae bacterium]
MNTRILSFLTLIIGLMISATSYAESEADVQNRMISRVPAVDALKTAGLVGETNRGFLEQKGRLNPEQSKVLADENADRRAIYGMIASRSGLTIGVVGEGRAEQIRQRSAPGVWLQAPNGDWYKK